jgi:hypothetical protein
MILRDLVLYRDGIINLEIRLVQVNIKGYKVIVNFNILPLSQDEVVLRMI